MNCPNKKRLRRTMMFLNAQKPSLIKDPHIYKPDFIMLDLEDAVAEDQKDTAKFSLYHALITLNHHECERVARINGPDTNLWKEDIRRAVAGGCDSIRIPKTGCPEDVTVVEKAIVAAEKEFDRPKGSVLITAAIKSAKGVLESYNIRTASERLFDIALSGGDRTKDLQTSITGTGIELMGARFQTVTSARAAGVQCLDTAYTDLDNMEGFCKDAEGIHLMGFDGKSIINPRQINIVHEIFIPSQKGITLAQRVVNETEIKKVQDIEVFATSGKMIDIVFYDGTKRILELAKASGAYKEVQQND